ncbi:hypothetical protein [Kribbella sandramycini]|uniref:4-amino-4-deoxy-L-arabinose transferase-like glycosyltransferase n=1 Tax=Kribbella sandramycini TaxID=60450 RepID=A0A841S7M9_9ACTN|nr:hypothetical protein [Kribbella sandramycini]
MPTLTGLAPWGVGTSARPTARPGRRTAVNHVVKAAAGVALAVLVLWLMAGASSADSIVALVRFWLLGITLPGVVLWRLGSPFRHNLIEDVAAGTLVGVAALLLIYMGVSPLGLQRWAWLWAVPVVLAAFGVPRWRRRVMSRVERPVGPVTAWLLAAACALPVYVIALPRNIAPAPYTDPGYNNPDMAYQQALSASAKYDFPLQAPYVHGEQMDYHYFFHQFTAAVAWATGVDLTDLIYTIGWIPLTLAGCALIFALADRLAPGSRWVGPLAIAVAAVGGTVNAYPGIGLPQESLTAYLWGSPTQNLGSGLTVLLAVLVVDLLRGWNGPGTWLLALLVAAAASGAKATILPLVLCGLGLVIFVQLCRRRLARRALVLAVGVTGVILAAIAVVFGNHSTGLSLKPWVTFAKTGIYPLIVWQRDYETGVYDHSSMWISAAVTCLAWLLGAAGLLVLAGTPKRWLRDTGVVFLVGVSIAGFFGMALTDQSGSSQMYFHRTAVPIIAVLAAVGAHQLVVGRRTGRLVAGAVLGGMAATLVARRLVKAIPSDGEPFRRPDATLTGIVLPWVLTLVLLLGVALVAALYMRKQPVRIACAAFVLAAMGAGLFLPLRGLPEIPEVTRAQLDRPLTEEMLLGPSATQAAAARWLRDHTAPDELIATNAHCAERSAMGCDARHFWIAGLSERHVLVEGWAYTNTINDQVVSTALNPNILPFWDQPKLAENDLVFTAPTRDNLQNLRAKYGVRWLYADPGQGAVSPELDAFATLRFSAPDALIYQLR